MQCEDLIGPVPPDARLQFADSLPKGFESRGERALERLLGKVGPLRRLLDSLDGFAEKRASREASETQAGTLQSRCDTAMEEGGTASDHAEQFGGIGHNQFRGGARRRRAKVGDKVGDGKINFMSHRGNQGQSRRGDRAGEGLVVELPEILDAATTACEDNGVHLSDAAVVLWMANGSRNR